VISVIECPQVKYGGIVFEDRLDAEYYLPEYIESLKVLKSIKDVPLLSLSSAEVSLDFKKSVIFGERTHFYSTKGVPFIRVSDIKNLTVDDYDMTFVPKELYGVSGIEIAEPRNILITESGTIGNIAIIPDSHPKWMLSGDVICIVVNPRIKPEYIAVFLESKYGKHQLLRGKTQQVQPHLYAEKVMKTLIPLAPENLQSFCSERVQQSLQKRKRAKEELIEAQKLLTKLFFIDTLELKRERIYEVLNSQLEKHRRFDAEHYKPEYEQIQEMLESSPFKLQKLKEVINISKKAIDPRKEPEKEFLYVELANVDPATGDIKDCEMIKGYNAPSRARMSLKKGDVLVSSLSGSLENIALVSDEFDNAIGSTGFFVISSEAFLSEFLFLLFRNDFVKKQLEQKTTGSIMTAVSRGDFENMVIPKIPKEKQLEISNMVKRIFGLRKESDRLIQEAISKLEHFIEASGKVNQ
jgi:type I restriction enzyme S subunit